jgi:Cu/Ag efflux protein CusF
MLRTYPAGCCDCRISAIECSSGSLRCARNERFFSNLSGSLQSIFFLSGNNQVALIFGALAFAIVSLMALTSVDIAVKRLGQRVWKFLHLLIYLAVPLVLAHAFLIGSYFANPKSFIPASVDFVALTMPQYSLQENGPTLYSTNGVVMAVNTGEHYITINQDEVPGVMPAMIISYQVSENISSQISQLKEGDSVSITLAYDQGYLELYGITKR